MRCAKNKTVNYVFLVVIAGIFFGSSSCLIPDELIYPYEKNCDQQEPNAQALADEESDLDDDAKDRR